MKETMTVALLGHHWWDCSFQLLGGLSFFPIQTGCFEQGPVGEDAEAQANCGGEEPGFWARAQGPAPP